MFKPFYYSSSNFKRQNTIDSATIKENSARLATQNQRPTSALPKTTTESSNLLTKYLNYLKTKLYSFL